MKPAKAFGNVPHPMKEHGLRQLTCVVVTIFCALVVTPASAEASDPAAAEAALHGLEAHPHRAASAELVARARAALAQAARFRSTGDEPRAKIADRTARGWAEAARDAAEAALEEARALEARRAASDARTQAERERALLEEAIAHTGRLRAQLSSLRPAPQRTTSDEKP